MTLRKACSEQLRRLPGNLANGPETDAEVKLYLDVFERNVRSADHARRVVDALIETALFYPKIPELIATCQQFAEIPRVEPNYDCQECNGTGWQIVTRGEYEAAARCPKRCPIPAPSAKEVFA